MDPTTLVAIAALLIGTAAYAVLHRARRATGSQPQAANEIEWPGSYSEAFQRALDILGALEAQVITADPNRGHLQARASPNALSPQALIEVVLRTTEGITVVTLKSKSRRLTEDFIRIWNRLPEPADR